MKSERKMKIGYYLCRSKKRKSDQAVLVQHDNRQFPIHVLYNFDRDWPENTLKQRGLLGNRFFERPAFQHEEDVVRDNKRAVSYRYRNFTDLLGDEECAGTDSATLEAMTVALRKAAPGKILQEKDQHHAK